MSDLKLGLDVDLIFNIRANVVFFRLPVLAYENKARQENGLKRDDHRQQPKWIWIELRQTKRQRIYRDPDDEPQAVDYQKVHAAAEPCYPIRDPLERRKLFLHFDVDVARHACPQQIVRL